MHGGKKECLTHGVVEICSIGRACGVSRYFGTNGIMELRVRILSIDINEEFGNGIERAGEKIIE